jgi:hypothetical protein
MGAWMQPVAYVFGGWPLADQVALCLVWPVAAALACWRECARPVRENADDEPRGFDVMPPR